MVNVDLKDQIKKFGKVKFCQEIDDGKKFKVEITDGYHHRPSDAVKLIQIINTYVGHKFKNLVTCITTEGHFLYELKK